MKYLLLSLSLVLAAYVNAQVNPCQELVHPHVLDLSCARVYDYAFETEHHRITVPATDIDWEVVLHEMAANFDLKVLVLPKKEALFSLAVSLEVLHTQLESSFFNRKKTYSKLFKKYLTEPEQDYLDEQLKRVGEMKGLARLSLWKMMFDQAQSTRQYELVGDSLIQLGYRTPEHDAEDLDAVISAYLGYHYKRKGNYQKAVERFEHCYEIRKRRKDVLDVNLRRLRECYEALEQAQKIVALYDEVLELMDQPQRPFARYHVEEAMRFKAKIDLEWVLNYYENRFLKVYDWRKSNYQPSFSQIYQVDNDEDRLYWVEQYLKEMNKYVPTESLKFYSWGILELLKSYESQAIEEKRREIFEAYAYPQGDQTIWEASNSDYYNSWDEQYWFNEVPYGRLLQYTPLVEEKKQLLEHWMKMALRTKNDTIIEATALSVAEKLARIGYYELADQYFFQFYCETRRGKALSRHDWLNRAAYIYTNSQDAVERWVALARKYWGEAFAMEVYMQSILFLGEDPKDKIRYERYSKVLAFYQQTGNKQAEARMLRLLLSCRYDNKNDYTIYFQHAITLYELESKYLNNQSFSVLNTLVAELLRAESWDRKDLKKSIKVFRKWQKELKKRGDAWQTVLDWARNNELLLKKKLNA